MDLELKENVNDGPNQYSTGMDELLRSQSKLIEISLLL